MIKNILKKTLIITLLIILIQTIISYNNHCYALSDVTSDIGWESWQPTVEGDDELQDKASVILGVIRTIGIIVSVATLAFIGLKTMLGSVEEKANYKQAMMPWILGATMVFAITTIPSIIYDLTNSAFTTEVTAEGQGAYLDGYDDAAAWAYGIALQNDDDDAKILASISEQKEKIQTENDYWKGYKTCLGAIQGKENSYGAHAFELFMVASKIENGEITETNIAEKYKEQADKVNNTEHKASKSTYQMALTRITTQMTHWGVFSDIEKYNTWEEYVKGCDAAIDWVQSKTSDMSKQQALQAIENKKKETTKYVAYWYGYIDMLERIYDCCEESGTSIQTYVQYYNEIVSLVEQNQITSSNVDSSIATIQNQYKYEKKLELKAKIRRLELQKHIWNGDEYP